MHKSKLFFALTLVCLMAQPAVGEGIAKHFRETQNEKITVAAPPCIPCTQQCKLCYSGRTVWRCQRKCEAGGNPKVRKGVGCTLRFRICK